MSKTNRQVALAAASGKDAISGSGNFSTRRDPASTNVGWHEGTRLGNILAKRIAAGAIQQIVYSFWTPIAWKDSGVWVAADTYYSAITSSHHASKFYLIGPMHYVPEDAGMDEYLSVVEGRSIYERANGRRWGSYRAAVMA